MKNNDFIDGGDGYPGLYNLNITLPSDTTTFKCVEIRNNMAHMGKLRKTPFT